MEAQADKLVRLDEDAHRKAKVDAAKRGKTLKQYLADLIWGKEKTNGSGR